jgi:GTP-binding protein EngB required for normal cell division
MPEQEADRAAEVSSCGRRLATLQKVAARFGLDTLRPALDACVALSRGDAPIDVAVLGQFKSGKSSLLNALIGEDLLPVGVLPTTAVVTRVGGGPELRATATGLDGTVWPVDVADVGELVSEVRNANNARRVAVVDIVTPALADLPGIRLVDTPGLGSLHAHNTRSTLDWLPSVALALVAVSVERPLGEEDRRLIAAVRPLASRVIVVLTKADLVTTPELEEVRRFVAHGAREMLGLPPGAEPRIVPFSTRRECRDHVAVLRAGVLAPIARNVTAERETAVAHRIAHISGSARDLLEIALRAAETAADGRAALRAAVMDETVQEAVIASELALAARGVVETARPRFEAALTVHAGPVSGRIVSALGEMSTWRGNLAVQAARYRAFMREQMERELAPLEAVAAPIGTALVTGAEARLRRIAVACSDRLGRNASRALGVTLSPVEWEPPHVRVVAPSVTVGPTFMTHWDLLWWLLPMPLVGWIFRWHCRRKVPWEAWINLMRLGSGWTAATAEAIETTREEALAWVRTELRTLDAVLSTASDDAGAIREAIGQLDRLGRRDAEGGG